MKPEAEPLYHNIQLYVVIIAQRADVELSWCTIRAPRDCESAALISATETLSTLERLTTAFIDRAIKTNEGVAGLSAAMRGLSDARVAVMTTVAAIDADIRRMTRASAACRRLMTIPGVGQRA